MKMHAVEIKLQKKIAELEQEKKDMSQEHLWFKETHQQTKDDLWERLAQAETEKKTYKKRVKDMEEKYLSDLEAFKETNSSLALKVEAAFNGYLSLSFATCFRVDALQTPFNQPCAPYAEVLMKSQSFKGEMLTKSMNLKKGMLTKSMDICTRSWNLKRSRSSTKGT